MGKKAKAVHVAGDFLSPKGKSSNNQIYTINEDNNTVSVIDGLTDELIATINVGRQPVNVNGNPSTNRIYVTNKGDDTVSVIDAITDKKKTIDRI